MTKPFFLLAAILGFAFSTPHQVRAADEPSPLKRLEASPRHQEWVDVKTSMGRNIKSFVVYPEVKDKALAVIVIHENKGLTDWVRGVADQLAEAGFIAIAPDLLSGTGPNDGDTGSFPSIDAATKAIYELPADQVLDDIDGVYAYVKSLDAANGKVAVIGFCWGGGQAFNYASHNSEIAAAFPFYGSAPDMKAMASIQAPVYGFYGGNDARITGQTPTVADQMKQAGKEYEPVVYDGAGHGFMRSGEDGTGSDRDKKARAEAWARLKKHLNEL